MSALNSERAFVPLHIFFTGNTWGKRKTEVKLQKNAHTALLSNNGVVEVIKAVNKFENESVSTFIFFAKKQILFREQCSFENETVSTVGC